MAQNSKQKQILKTAGELFIRHGYHRVSMDAIASAVPVSKPTLYNNYADKKALFAAVIDERCQALLGEIKASLAENTPIQATLEELGRIFLGLVLSPESLKINRVMIAECADFPDMARKFYASGPEQLHAMLAKYLRQMQAKGKLRVPDALRSADMFLSALKGYAHVQCLLGLRKTVSAKEQKKTVQYVVKLFLKAHALA